MPSDEGVIRLHYKTSRMENIVVVILNIQFPISGFQILFHEVAAVGIL